MAEEFLEPIFKKSLLITDFEDSLSCLYRNDFQEAEKKYNLAISEIESLLPELAIVNENLTNRILDCAQKITDCWNNPASASGLISRSLIPLLYEYMSFFTNIDVAEGIYRIHSTDSGFLTITDTECGITFHDIHNPMSEAIMLAKSIYSPTNKEIHIFGCDLGFLPYVIYKKSGGSCKIVIYENNQTLINYARQFGILSWIPDGICDFVTTADPQELAKRFLLFLNNNQNIYMTNSVSAHINHWMRTRYKNLGIDQIDKQSYILLFQRNKYNLCVINMMKNYDKPHIAFNELKKTLSSNEWIVIAAGPSLDESISFIKKESGQKKIVAVNTVLKRLPSEGITPDLIVAADPRPQLLDHIKGYEDTTKDITLVADETTCWEFINHYQGELCLIPTPNGVGLPLSNPDKINIWPISGTVVTLGIEVALRLGAKKIFLVGLDLAFPGGISYAKGVSQKREEGKKGNSTVQSVDGKIIASNQTFDMFRTIIEQQIAKHPEVTFINMSPHGALIKGAKNP
ncbi:motility associated factor glycosyltransferase family protein [Butyrivibrio fibrisolvens]|uniref:motility associated factor glycosyltransferase family protein n=1 Tax=Butyrivibrio fibrisolvens TaxID=831 RepID=UPI000420C433|nr:6-hydroxymethylpterin diphosphokinase MptE-like protein [Butyrivibrio fibrisolvens]